MTACDIRPPGRDEEAAAARRTVAVFAVCGFASTFAMRFVDPMIGVIARDLQADPHTVALLSSAFALPYALVQPVLGPVGDGLGKERIIKICMAVLAVALALSCFTADLRLVFGLRILAGAAGGGVIPLVLASIADRVPMAERQVAIGRFLLFSITGQLLGGTLAGLLTGLVGWRGVFALAGGLAAVGALAITLGLRGPGASIGRLSVSSAVARYGRIIAIPRARALYAFVFVEGAFIFGVQPYIATLLEGRGAGGPTEAGFIIAGFATGGILYTLAVRQLLRVLGVRRMLLVAGALAFLAFLTLAAGRTWPVDAGAMLAMGVGFYMLHNSFQTQVTEVVVDARASAVSLHAFSYFMGQAIGPALFGFYLSSLGVTAAMAISGAGTLALGLVAARVIGGRG